MATTATATATAKPIRATMNRQTVLDVIKLAETNHGFIGIRGYVSETGREANYVLQPYGENGYIRLVQESLEQLQNGEVEKPKKVFGEAIDTETWEEAVSEQIASFEKTLAGGHGRKDRKEKEDKGFYSIDGIPFVFNVRVVSYNETPEQAENNAALGDKIKKIPKSLKAKAKKHIRTSVKLGGYRGMFKLDPSKFDRLAWDKNEIKIANLGTLVTL